MTKSAYSHLLTLLLITIILQGCKKIIEIQPKTDIDATVVYADDETATAAVFGLYAKFMTNISMLNGYLSRYLSLYADELIKNSNNSIDNAFLNNDLNSSNEIVTECWHAGFNYINHTNAILEKLATSKNLSSKARQELEGETRFIRALVYFYLVNLYGNIPLVLQTDPQKNAALPRSSETEIYQQIILDLQEAQQKLPYAREDNETPDLKRTRATKTAATALLARVYVYTGNWEAAIFQCNQVLNDNSIFLESDPDNVFLARSNETILAFYPTNTLYNTAEGRIFGLNPTTSNTAFLLTEHVTGAFQASDLRLLKWTKTVAINTGISRRVYKYKIFESSSIIEHTIVLRLAEIYLLRSEAYLALNQYEQAIDDINTIRQRANASRISHSTNKRKILLAIEKEWQLEYFTEFGQRWFNIRRWPAVNPSTANKTRADDILTLAKPQHWKAYKKYWPIPKDELMKSSTLSQNAGYD